MAQVQYKSETLIKGNKRTKTSRLDSSESDDVYCNRFPLKKTNFVPDQSDAVASGRRRRGPPSEKPAQVVPQDATNRFVRPAHS